MRGVWKNAEMAERNEKIPDMAIQAVDKFHKRTYCIDIDLKWNINGIYLESAEGRKSENGNDNRRD